MTSISNIWKQLTSILSNLNNFHSLEVVDRVSETQLQVGENSDWIIWRLKGVKEMIYQRERDMWIVRKGMYKKIVIFNDCIANIEMWWWWKVRSIGGIRSMVSLFFTWHVHSEWGFIVSRKVISILRDTVTLNQGLTCHDNIGKVILPYIVKVILSTWFCFGDSSILFFLFFFVYLENIHILIVSVRSWFCFRDSSILYCLF